MLLYNNKSKCAIILLSKYNMIFIGVIIYECDFGRKYEKLLRYYI
jgi:hypothetical protein